ncbi:MAG: hypothetical protein COB46_08465 [Rhodospirillaceae bacterium]|nr:MAG: hypothetical protein COB46_08465 [Rhodospirillaceae bacterium]
MADNPKASWPKTPDGTTDWEVVFEDGTIGFIALTCRAHSPEMVEKTAVVIIKKLFTRRNDLDLCQQNIHRTNKIVTDHKDDLARIHEEIAVLMREIKNERIELARVFVERKEAGAAIDRRAGLWWKAGDIFKPKIMVPVAGVLVTAVVAIAYFLLQPDQKPVDAYTESFGQSEPVEPTTPIAKPDDATKPDPIPIWLKTVRWPLMPKTDGAPPRFYSVTLYVADHDIKSLVCERAPSIMDKIIIAYGTTMPQGRDPRVDEISDAQDEVQTLVNQMLSIDLIESVKIARYGTKEFKAASLPPFCKSPPRLF